MRRLLALLLLASLLAGCTSDGNLGAIDERQQQEQAHARAASLWRAPGAQHPIVIDVTAGELHLQGDLAPVRLSGATFVPSGTPELERLALEGAVVQGTRGWLVLPAPTLALRAEEGEIVFPRPTLVTDVGALAVSLTSGLALEPVPPFGCFDEPTHHEPPACAPWRETRPLPPPEPLRDRSLHRYDGVELPARARLDVANATFYDAGGNATALSGPIAVGSASARLVGLVRAPERSPLDATALRVALPAGARVAWDGNLTIAARDVTGGRATFPDGDHPLDAFGRVRVALHGNGNHQPTYDAATARWRLGPIEARTTSLKTDDVQRLAASLRLLPDLVEGSAPVGNVTRVKLILAEASRGADAQLKGYRIDASVRARYVGAEPFAVTNALIDVMERTDLGLATPAVLLGVGISLPFFAIAESFLAFFQSIFPPSLEGALPAGEAQLLTFELLVPNQTTEVEILIEAENAEPARARVRLTPT